MARSRARKPRLSRMDAAVDAMAPFGFPAVNVRKHVKLLLQVYGGDDGWPFIEEYSYKELIDAMLRDAGGEEKEEERAMLTDVEEQPVEDKDQSNEKKTFVDESGAGTSTRDEGPRDNNFPAAAPSCSSTELKSPEINNASSLTNRIVPLQPDDSLPPPRHRRHCYGWIDSDDEENDFVYLKPAPGVFGGKKEAALPPKDRIRSGGNRKSQWDLRPEDH